MSAIVLFLGLRALGLAGFIFALKDVDCVYQSCSRVW